MKLMVLLSILAPFFKSVSIPEIVSIVMFLNIPLIWSSWELHNPFTLGLMVDKLSVILIFLTLWTCIIMLFLKPSDSYLKMNIILLLISLIWFFSVSSFLLLFVTFEVSLIPTLCLIMGWGYQPERVEASFYFMFYTISFSLPLLVSLIWLTSISSDKFLLNNEALYGVCSGFLGFYILLVFMIKLPLFMLHLWLPKAHVEAPLVGSMILAGVLLKTGGYGVIRVFSYMSKTLTDLMFSIVGLVGMVYMCFVCTCCVDLKQLIAFSSVSHMNFMVVGLMNNSTSSYCGSIIMMISHGISSSFMFMLADFSYKRFTTRSILMNKGSLMLTPILSFLWSFAVLFNMAVPPSAGSISELLIIFSCKSYNFLYWLMFVMYLFTSGMYSVYIYTATNHGISDNYFMSVETKETLMSVAHLVPLVSLSLLMKFMLM